jgi:signal transduction histidine kinase
MKGTTISTFCLSLLTILLIFNCPNGFSQSARKGIARFSVKSKQSDNILNISGEWQFYYGKHLSASEMKQLKQKDKHYVFIPSNWKGTLINGKKLPAFGAGTYYLQVIIDTARSTNSEPYEFHIGDITSAYTLWVNDRLIMKVGNATSDSTGFQPMYYPHTGVITTNRDTLDVVLHVSNFYYPNFSGISRDIFFGTEQAIDRLSSLKTASDAIILGIFIVLFLFQFLVYFSGSKDKSHLLIAALSFLFFMKMMLDGNVTVFHYFPHFNYYIGYRLWILTFLAVPVVFKIIQAAFPFEMNRYIENGVLLVYGTYGILTLILPLNALLTNLIYITYFTIACVAYLFYVMMIAVVHKRPSSVIHIVSFSVMLLLFMNDLITISNPGKVDFLSQIGVCLYITVQSLIVWFKFSDAHRLTVKLKQELETTNQNLETIVDERTTELRDSNTQLAKLNKQKDFLITTISHDLKNSFNVLINLSKILSEETESNTEQRNLADMLHEASQRGYRVLEDILDWAKVQITNYNEIKVIKNFSELAEEDSQFYQNSLKAKSLKIKFIIDDKLHFNCNESQLHTILRNLISNAIKFSKEGGEIVLGNREKDNFVQIYIHDDGIGIPEEMATTLFDTTINNKRKGTSGEMGTGLGLLIVKELTESNQGTITLGCPGEKGSEFIVSFPGIRS